jgi:hypothetical protein
MPRPVALTLWSLAAACLFAFCAATTIIVHQDRSNQNLVERAGPGAGRLYAPLA